MNISTYIASGILEKFVLGDINEQEKAEVEQMARQYPAIQQEIESISLALENYALSHATAPDPIVKEKLLAKVEGQTLFNKWKSAAETTQASSSYDNIHSTLLEKSGPKSVMVVWAKEEIPLEMHTRTLESFWVLEGSCDCYIGDELTSMEVGDFMEIPLHIPHRIAITSPTPLKALLYSYKLSA